MTAPEFEPMTLARDDGQTLHGWRSVLENPRAIVQICHGLVEHAERYKRFATALAQAGIGCCVFDIRGHGAQALRAGTLGVFAKSGGSRLVVDDQAAIAGHLAELHPGTPIILMGHSMGALIAANAMLRHGPRFSAAILMNSDFSGGLLLAAAKIGLAIERMFLGSDVPSRLAPKLTFKAWNAVYKPNRTDFDWLNRDETEVDKYIADPLCGWLASNSMWRDLLGFAAFIADDANLKRGETSMPIHLIGGTGDPSSRMSKAIIELEARLHKAGYSRVTACIYKDARHETLNETIRDEAAADIIAWIDSVL